MSEIADKTRYALCLNDMKYLSDDRFGQLQKKSNLNLYDLLKPYDIRATDASQSIFAVSAKLESYN